MNNQSKIRLGLAPMEGVVDPVLRSIYSQIGGYDHMVTEFIRITQQLLPKEIFYKYCPELLTGGKTSTGVPVYIQLLGSSPEYLYENANRAYELGSLGLDMNFGCPAKTVNRHDGGATLLKNPDRIYQILHHLRVNLPSHFPITAKVRLGFSDKSLVREIAQAVNQAKVQGLTVHARTKLEGYAPPAHWEFIATMKEEASTIPVTANGDIWTLEDYIQCKKITQCNSFALGRPAIANPFLALEIKFWEKQWADSQGNPQAPQFQNPWETSWENFNQTWFQKFVEKCYDFRGEKFCLARTKQWLKFLGRHFKEAESLFTEIKTLQNINDVRNCLNKNM